MKASVSFDLRRIRYTLTFPELGRFLVACFVGSVALFALLGGLAECAKNRSFVLSPDPNPTGAHDTIFLLIWLAASAWISFPRITRPKGAA